MIINFSNDLSHSIPTDIGVASYGRANTSTHLVNPTRMKPLIVFYSFTRNNEKLSTYLQTRLGCEVGRIETTKSRNGFSILLDLMFNRAPAIKAIPFDVGKFEHIILIAPIWAGKIAMPMKTFIKSQKSNFKTYSFVTLCGGGPGQKQKIQNQLMDLTGKSPKHVVELWINNLLSDEKKNTVKNTTAYRIEPSELSRYDRELEELFGSVEVA